MSKQNQAIPKYIVSALIFYVLSLSGSIFEFDLKYISDNYGLYGVIIAIAIPVIVIIFLVARYKRF